MNMMKSLKSLIHEEALRLGFFKVGIASARSLPFLDAYRAWLSSGRHGTMSYMQRQAKKRENPERVLAGVRTILVLAMNYFSDAPPACSPIMGRVSRYALGRDYHGVVLSRLKGLLQFIQRLAPSVNGICYADSGPVMEKVWGAETGLGWMGKHSNLVIRERGSWFFIGVILLDAAMESDAREKDLCGSCTRCMQACPTGAIAEPYVVDARRCISYLTIELRGAIPRSLRSMIGNRVFGCDDCQEVCPWNRFASIASESGFQPRPESVNLPLTELVRMTPREFEMRFEDSPILRATRDGFVRNVAVALGNSRCEEAVSALGKAVYDRSALVRSHAAWALGQIATETAFCALKEAVATERDPEVLSEINLALNTHLRMGA